MRFRIITQIMLLFSRGFIPKNFGNAFKQHSSRSFIRRTQWTTPGQHIVGHAKSVGQAHYELGNEALSGLPKHALDGGLFTVLGIETSCDDTGVAIVRSDGVILGQAVASQHKIHEEFGGIRPSLARDAHVKNLDALVQTALDEAGMLETEVDAFASTVGPGLELCLRVGANLGRNMAKHQNKPFVGVHHLEAHCLLARASLRTNQNIQEKEEEDEKIDFPFVALLVSGGHCQILLVHGVGRYTVLGSTLDDAVGEAFDKAARMLGLASSTNGGPVIEKIAREGDPNSYALPLPMSNAKNRKGCNFSFSGLKNAFRLTVQKSLFLDELIEFENEDDARVVRECITLSSSSNSNSMTSLNSKISNEGKKAIARAVNVEEIGALLPHQTKANLAASFQKVAISHLLDKFSQSLDVCDEIYQQHRYLKENPLAAKQEMIQPNILNQNDKQKKMFKKKKKNIKKEFNRTEIIQNKEFNQFELFEPIKSIAVVGGVAANQMLRSQLIELIQKRKNPLTLIAPPPSLCTDNGVMIAWAAIEKMRLGVSDRVVLEQPPPDENGHIARPIDVMPRWPLGPELRR